MTRPWRTWGIAGALLALTGVLAGCGGSQPDVGGNRTRHVTAAEKYVALGDSYTSAPQVGNPTGPTQCQQTSANYPHLIAKELGLDLHDSSCAGAKTSDLTGHQVVAGFRVPPQMDALDKDTGLVTLSIGANDQNIFGNMVLTCAKLGLTDPTGSPCADASGGGAAQMDSYQRKLEGRISAAIAEIARRSPKARVLVIGYPQIFPRSGNCPELPFASGDVAFAHDVLLLLNDAVRAAAEHAHADYIDLWAASKGHDICSKDPWMAGARPIHPAIAYHPYAVEEQAVADLVVKALKK